MSGNDRDLQDGSREEWFDDLFRRHHVAIRSYALRRAPSEADDIVSEVFTVAWRKRDEVPDHPLPWLYAVAARETLHAVRSSHRREHYQRRAAAQAQLSAPDDIEAVDARLSAQDPVRAAMARLSERDNEVLRLWAWERLEPAEISAALGISRTAARVRLHRARVRIERILREYCAAEAPRPEPVIHRDQPPAIAAPHGGN
ncbi:RNA polymerase sigma factor [Ornithinimicrobium faecis]|uniref:RNA polymerase sigma factor n=1 Tax=Ornithinimicrobium faecis TaxID=2934158 RepID=UPI002117E356|nr:sigma-70 family RNA polymerase sigma factor [Ornithinimicrobium sp. HY1745]